MQPSTACAFCELFNMEKKLPGWKHRERFDSKGREEHLFTMVTTVGQWTFRIGVLVRGFRTEGHRFGWRAAVQSGPAVPGFTTGQWRSFHFIEDAPTAARVVLSQINMFARVMERELTGKPHVVEQYTPRF